MRKLNTLGGILALIVVVVVFLLIVAMIPDPIGLAIVMIFGFIAWRSRR